MIVLLNTAHSLEVAEKEIGLPVGQLMTPKGTRNLLIASRGISADVEAASSLRIMPVVMCIGQAAGQAAAAALPEGDVRRIDVQALRASIRDAGGILEPKQKG